MSEWPHHYILVGRTPIAVDLMTWAEWFEKADRIVEVTKISSKCNVSTVFLGLDHSWLLGGEPILFETMIFGGPLDGDQWRYHTYDQAERGHAAAVKLAMKAVAKVKAIADRAGVKEK